MTKSIDKQHIAIVRKLVREYEPAYDKSWLPEHPSLAFLVCVAQGPWVIQRRAAVATCAVEWLLDELRDDPRPIDLSSLRPMTAHLPYPLEWQNRILLNMVRSLRRQGKTFSEVVCGWLDLLILVGVEKEWRTIPQELFSMCGVPEKGTKTLWLFVRDYFESPAFPIDRRVKAKLKQHGLPVDSWRMTELCVRAGIHTNDLARGMFFSKRDAAA